LFKTTHEVLLRYMMCVGFVALSAATFRMSIMTSNADLRAASLVWELTTCEMVFAFVNGDDSPL
jgi:hypothetical protein